MLSTKARRLYRRLLDLGPIRRVDAAADGIDDSALAELLNHGLVREIGELLTAVPPRTARGQVAMLANQRSRAVLESAAEAEAFLASCLSRDERPNLAEPPVELISERSEIVLLSITLQRRARREVLSVQTQHFPEPSGQARNVVGPIESDVTAGIRYRVIYAEAFAEDDLWHRDIEESVACGEEARVHPALPLKFKVIDGSSALIPLDEAAETGALLIRSAPMCDLLVDYFEKLWNESGPLTHGSIHGGGPLRPVEKRVLELLVDDLSDAVIAKRLRISERSVRRHVSRLQEAFGVETRTGALATAKRNGWLSL